MRVRPLLALSLVALPLAAACGPSISSINARPDKYYEHKLSLVARVVRTQFLPHETLLEVADARGARIIVRSAEPVDAEVGDWVRIEGVLVPEVKVEDAVLYDVVSAERVSRTRAPRFRNIM
jgi:hypothetical protein